MASTAARRGLEQQSHTAEPFIVTRGLGKEAKGTRILSGIDLEVEPGQVFGLIGPSGCGKTTLVRLLVGLMEPTEGEVGVFGRDPLRFTTRDREGIGYMPQGSFLYPTLSIQQNAHFAAALYGVGWLRRRRRVRDLLRMVELDDVRGRLVRRTSGGMQRRLSLVCALAHQPAVLFADEPTTGLDPVLREKIWGYLHAWKERGLTIVLTTQYIDEIRHCDRVALMRDGRILAVDSPEGLRRRAMPRDVLEIQLAGGPPRAAVDTLRGLDWVHEATWRPDGAIRVVVDDGDTATPEITRVLQGVGMTVEAVHPSVHTFDEVFKELVAATGRSADVPKTRRAA